MKRVVQCVLVLASICSLTNAQKKSVIAHMTNTKGAVKWGLDKGANGVELDLVFTRNGFPSLFRHGGICDCSCVCPVGCTNQGVCSALWKEVGSHCGASTSVCEMFSYLGSEELREKLAIIYIDSKMVNSMKDYYGAGGRVVNMLDEYVFEKGFKGQVIISGLKAPYIDYLRGALDAAKKSKYGDRYYYTMDGEAKNFNRVWNTLLTLGTRNIFYSTGISSCVAMNFKYAILQSVGKDGYAGVGIWTLDKKSSMEEYLDYGVTSIMTNYPGIAADLIGKENIAKPGEALRPVRQDLPFKEPHSCDCGYRNDTFLKLGGGGCIITNAPPRNHACKCSVNKPWTCKGEVVSCKDPSSSFCKNPIDNKETCKQGNGDCDGY